MSRSHEGPRIVQGVSPIEICDRKHALLQSRRVNLLGIKAESWDFQFIDFWVGHMAGLTRIFQMPNKIICIEFLNL